MQKFLKNIKENINLISFIAGVGFFVAGKAEIGHILINRSM